MHVTNRILLAAAAALFLTQAQAEDRAGTEQNERPSCKTPYGVGRCVKADDPVLVAAPAAHAASPVTLAPALVQRLIALAEQSLTALSEKSSATDTQYYENGRWYYGEPSAPGTWLYQAGPAGMAAALWKYRHAHPEAMDAAARSRQDWLRQVALATFERALKEHQKPDGDFGDLAASHREFFTIDFVNTYLLLKDTLDAETRERWLDAMKREVEFMVAKGGYPDPSLIGNPRAAAWKGTDGWYINGNVELAKAEFIYLVWLASGEPKYQALFELQWRHALRPNWQRWGKLGYGLFYFAEPTKPDGSDGQAFLAEANAVPGFDKEYGMLQVSIAARLYAKSHDPRALRLTNLLLNVLRPYLDEQTMLLDATYGSRKSSLLPFSTCAPLILAAGGRNDLTPMLGGQFDLGIRPSYLDNARLNQCNYGLLRGYGFDLAAMIEAISSSR